ncbi:MAG: ATP-binding protein [Bacteroidetes bacterium]|nr:ATP-binding protein [Bacteroidota bacterium]
MVRSSLVLFYFLFSFLPLVYGQAPSNSWQEVKENGSGTLVVAYSENSPFIYLNSRGEVVGIEYEILKEFVQFIEAQYGSKLNLVWEHLNTFDALLDTLKDSKRSVLGIASISTLEERKKDFNISNSYMPDIEVIVSSGEFRSVGSLGEFARMVKENKAITVTSSTFERNILELKSDYFPDIEIRYVPHVDILIEEVSNSDNAWGYISLPNYLSYYKSGKDISRQRYFMVENPGLSMATPLSSDWVEALDLFIADSTFKPMMDALVEKHLGPAFTRVVEQMSGQNSDLSTDAAANREVGVLTLERELQDLKLKQSELEISRKNQVIAVAIIGIVLVLVALVALYRLIRLKSISNKSLSEKNRQIEQQNLELNSLSEEKNELIGIVVHDLKNPLTSAISVADLFLQEKITEDQGEYLSLIRKSLKRMNGLVAKILEIKVLESLSLQINYSLLNLKEVTQQVITSLKVQSDNKGIEIKEELDDSRANLDRSLLVQILDNLLSNAIKFSDRDTSICVTLKGSESTVRFEVKDQGPGISEADKPNLFLKFQQLEARPTSGENSTGLGLSIVKKYVEAMEGRVWCETVPGEGSTFIVEFNGFGG